MTQRTERSDTSSKISPILEREFARARSDINAYAEDLLAAEVTEIQIQAAIQHAENRIKEDYDRLQQDDPIAKIREVLGQTAQTDQELRFVQYHMENLERERDLWREIVRDDPRPLRQVGHPPTTIRTSFDPEENGIEFIIMRNESGVGTIGESILDFIERVGKNLGALDNEGLAGLQGLPLRQKGVNTPYLQPETWGRFEHAGCLLTYIDGITATIGAGRSRSDHSISICVSSPALERMLVIPRGRQ